MTPCTKASAATHTNCLLEAGNRVSDAGQRFGRVVSALVRHVYQRLIAACSGRSVRVRQVQPKALSRANATPLAERDFMTLNHRDHPLLFVSHYRLPATPTDAAPTTNGLQALRPAVPAPRLSHKGQEVLAAVREWQRANPPQPSNMGADVLHDNGELQTRLSAYLREACAAAMAPLLNAVVSAASLEIQASEHKKGGLKQGDRELIVLRHLCNHFLDDDPSQPGPMVRVVPVEVRDFLRSLRQEVRTWASPASGAGFDVEGTVRSVVPAVFIRRGVAAWAIQQKVGEGGKILSPELGVCLNHWLTDLTRGESSAAPRDSTAAANLQLCSEHLRSRFQAEFEALVA